MRYIGDSDAALANTADIPYVVCGPLLCQSSTDKRVCAPRVVGPKRRLLHQLFLPIGFQSLRPVRPLEELDCPSDELLERKRGIVVTSWTSEHGDTTDLEKLVVATVSRVDFLGEPRLFLQVVHGERSCDVHAGRVRPASAVGTGTPAELIGSGRVYVRQGVAADVVTRGRALVAHCIELESAS